ncbi:MarR family winged helix-turn-helix transcriptional regulator [Umezawaea beigongshangensis]|uniref:MarR family winged helix-turn-helix transcriptional regulator n=1 Tax=Umezawaea beigongshangensis TaxID=2780383 RepID=UPI0018F2374D|nr:MarR family winged helix-turn-helix transcriptional regulator [Umezawaea beigongshangensis]
MTDDSWLNEDEQRAWRSYLAVQTKLSSRLNAHLQRESGLSGSDYEVLVHLSEAPEGRMRAFELGEATRWEKSRISHHLTRMAGRGLVERQPCAEDSRYADVVLTEAGRTAIVEAAPRHVAHVREWFVDAMSPEELAAFAAACEAVAEKLDSSADGDCPSAREC